MIEINKYIKLELKKYYKSFQISINKDSLKYL